MTKTNKSFLNRLKITCRGKVLTRIPGKNHFNAKASGAKQLRQKGLRGFKIDKRTLKQFMPYVKV